MELIFTAIAAIIVVIITVIGIIGGFSERMKKRTNKWLEEISELEAKMAELEKRVAELEKNKKENNDFGG